MTKPDTLEVPVWVKRGALIIRRDALPKSDPDCTYNFIKRTYDVEPEQYGVFEPQDVNGGRTDYEIPGDYNLPYGEQHDQA